MQQQQQRVSQSHIDCLSSLWLCSTWARAASAAGSGYDKAYCALGLTSFKRLLQVRSESHMYGLSMPSTQRQQPCWQQANADSKLLPLPPQHLTVTIKLLIEIVLLLSPSKQVDLQADCLENIVLLLHMSSSSTATHSVDPHLSAPMPPTAVVAGLLLPVVQLLSRVVVQALKDTEPQQHAAQPKQQPAQQQQHQEKTESTNPAVLNENRRLLLRHFGNLLIMVCQAGEWTLSGMHT